MLDGVFLSEYLKIDRNILEEKGIFDSIVSSDSPFFINLLRLKQANTEEFTESYKSINKYFSDIATILDFAKNPSKKDTFYKRALEKFNFSEVNGINLGFSKSTSGSGFGPILKETVIKDAYEIVKAGIIRPEIFHLVPLFVDNVGPDRLSDMIATIILEDIKAYTKRTMVELGINETVRPDLSYTDDGFIKNEFKECPVYFLPIEILHELPIAKSWEDVDDAVGKNAIIRSEINVFIADEWSNWDIKRKKNYIKRFVFEDKDICSRVLEGYSNEELEEFQPKNNFDYHVLQLFKQFMHIICMESKLKHHVIDSFTGAIDIINIFKDCVENNKGWDLIASEKRNKEKLAQRIIHYCAKHYVKINNFDFSCEPNEGPGPVDFKLSRGCDKTVVEIKLSSNQ